MGDGAVILERLSSEGKNSLRLLTLIHTYREDNKERHLHRQITRVGKKDHDKKATRMLSKASSQHER